jgi:hypothetical protein
MEQQINIVLDTVRSFMVELGQFLPKLIGAIIILIAGWLIAKFLRFVVVRSLRSIGFNVVTDKAGLDEFLKKGGGRKDTIEVLGLLVYWLAILATLLIGFNSLGLTVVSELFSRITQFVPNVIVAVLILTIGLYFARFVADAVVSYSRNVGMEDADLVGRVTRYAIGIFVVVIALGQMNIADRILYPALLILFGGAVLAMALAFGLGGQKWAADQLEKLMKVKGKK